MRTPCTLALLLPALAALAPAQDPGVSRRRAIDVQETRARQVLSPAIVPADSAFLVHVDVQGILGSTFWKAVDGAVGLSDEITGDEDYAEIKSEFGIDPFRDLLSVTVFGKDPDGDDAVVVFRTTSAVDKALAKLRAMDQYAILPRAGLQLETWSEDGDDDDRVHAVVLGDAASSERRIVIGQNPDRVAVTVRTMLKEAPSMASAAQPALRAQPHAGSYIYVEVGLPMGELLQGTPASKIASKARRFSADIGEQNGNVYLDALVATVNADDARDVADVVNGVRSMIELSGMLEKLPLVFSDVFDGVRAELDGEAVRLRLSVDSGDLLEGLEELQDMRR